MEKERKLYRSVTIVACVTGIILLVPWIAMQFTEEVAWTASDFLIMGALLFSIGISYVVVTRNAPNIIYRSAMALGLGATLFMIWANLAVGLIGSGAHAGNIMYVAVVIVGITGTLLSRLRASGMEYTMYAMAWTFVLLTVIAFVAGMHEYPGSSVREILGVNGFLATPFVISGLMFRQSREQHAPARR